MIGECHIIEKREQQTHNETKLKTRPAGAISKRSRSPSSPFFPDATTFSDRKPASEATKLNPEDVTARLEDLEVKIDTLHADTEDKAPDLSYCRFSRSLPRMRSQFADKGS
ncbi:hypothetical protein Tco_0537126 [Tanacetum coccineum]